MNSQNQNLIIAVVLSALIMMGFHHFYEAPREEALKQAEAQEQAQKLSAGGDTPSGTLAPLPDGGTVRSRGEAVADSPRIGIKNPRLYGALATTGIKLDDLTLADYFTALDHKDHVDLLSPSGTDSPYYATIGWVAQDAATAVPDARTKWTVTGSGALSPDHPVTMSWDNGHGLLFKRTLSLDGDYMFTIQQDVQNNGGAPVTLYPYTSIVRQGEPAATSRSGREGAVGVIEKRLKRFDYSDLKGDKLEKSDATERTTGGWVGFSDKYWLVAAIPDQAEPVTVQFRHSVSDAKDLYETDYRAEGKTIAPGAETSDTSHLFAGAKQVHLLTAYRDRLGIPSFEMAVDWGWFWFLTKPFFYGIDFLAKALGNFGLGILAFTVVIRIFIFPLAWKTYREMNRMSTLAPKMAAIKAKYGHTNKEAMQAEVMELYQTEKVNPISGCLPMFLQIPIFISLFKVLSTTIEMRQQPFYGYIHDLSAEDTTNVFTLFGLLPADWHIGLFNVHLPPHLGILPLILGGTMILIQKGGPKPADPVQARMMMINPVIFTFIMANLPVGLVIYYIWSNTLSVCQQRFIKWYYRARYKKDPTAELPTDPVQAIDNAAKEV